MQISVEQHLAERRSPERDAMLDKATDFFYEHGGFSYDPEFEDPDDGRKRCARMAAEAELYGLDHGWEVEWEDDWGVDHVAEFPDAYDHEPSTCEIATLRDEDGDSLASLGCVDDGDENYRRVVAADLAIEATRRMHSGGHVEHYYDGDRDREITTCGFCGLQWCAVCDPAPSARCHNEYEHEETQHGDSRGYLVGLPVGITVWDDGKVEYVLDTSEAGAAIFDDTSEQEHDEDDMIDDRERIEDDRARRVPTPLLDVTGERSVIDGLTACNLTCSEAEELAEFFRRMDKPGLAERVLAEHAAGDDSDEDDHHDGYDPDHTCIEEAK